MTGKLRGGHTEAPLKGGHTGPPLLAMALAVLLAIPAAAQPRNDQAAATPKVQRPSQPAQPAKPAVPAPPAPPAAPGEPPVAPVPPPPPPPPEPVLPINVRIDVTITEQQGGGTPTKKSVSLVVADGESGAARSEAIVFRDGPQHLPLNVDARPRILDNNRVRVRLIVNWTVLAPPEMKNANSTQVTQQVAPILESGKPLVVAQSADPVTDRQVTVEAKATILR